MALYGVIWRYQSLVILFFSFIVNQLVLVLYSGTIQFQAERDLKLTRLSALTCPHLVKFLKHSKSGTAFLREIVIIFAPIYLSEATYVVSSFNLMTEL